MIGGASLSRLWIQSRRAALLLLAPGRAWRAFRNPAFRRAFPAYAASLRAALFVTGGFVVAATLIAPAAGLAAVLVLAAVALGLRWRARPRYGAGRGLPPGRLDFLAAGPFLDPAFYLTAARTHGPVFKCSALARSQVCVVGLGAGTEILRIFAAHLRPLSLPFHRFVPGGFLRRMEEPPHDTYRRLFASALSRSLIEGWRPVMAAAATRGLARLAAASASAGPQGVAPSPHVELLVREAWLTVFLGVEAGSAEAARLDELFAVIDIRNLQRAPPSAIHAALAGIEASMERQVIGATGSRESAEARRSSVLHEILDREPDALRDVTVVRNLIYMLNMSAGDVGGLLMWVLKQLCEHPAWAKRLRMEAASSSERPDIQAPPLAARIVSETLRLKQSEFVMRDIVEPFRHGGFRFPRGWLLRICVQESHRDPEVFDRPEEFDPDRFLETTLPREQYAPFGLDRHLCVGEHLTRAMGEVFAGALGGYDWEVASDGPTEVNDWRHWAPSARFRVRLTARPATPTPGRAAREAPDR